MFEHDFIRKAVPTFRNHVLGVSSFDGTISGIFEIVLAFGELNGFDQPADMTPYVVDGALLCISHPVFNLGEGLFDRIKVRRIGWQEPEPRTGCFDQLSDGCRLVAAEIIRFPLTSDVSCSLLRSTTEALSRGAGSRPEGSKLKMTSP